MRNYLNFYIIRQYQLMHYVFTLVTQENCFTVEC